MPVIPESPEVDDCFTVTHYHMVHGDEELVDDALHPIGQLGSNYVANYLQSVTNDVSICSWPVERACRHAAEDGWQLNSLVGFKIRDSVQIRAVVRR